MNNIVDLACQLEETCRFCYPPEKERILYTIGLCAQLGFNQVYCS